MHTLEIPDRKIFKEFASEIEEMTGEQYIYFVELILKYQNGDISAQMLKVLLVKKLLGIHLGLKFFFLSKETQEQINGEIFRLSEQMESFFYEEIRDGKQVKSIKLSFVKNLIPIIYKSLHGPADALADITFCEYRMAHSFYRDYLKTRNSDSMNHLIAVLYRPAKRVLWLRKFMPGFDGQNRKPFTAKSNPILLDRRAVKIARLPLSIRYGIFLWFCGCEEYLVKGRPVIDGQEIDLSILYKESENAGKEPNIGLVGLLYTLSESKVFGSIEETDQQNLYDVMARLYQVVLQQQEMDNKFESVRNGTNS